MDKTIKLLGVLLAAQLLLALWAFSGGPDLSAQRPEESLLNFDPGAVTGVLIEGPDDTQVTLSKGDDGWKLTDAWDAPVNSTKVDQLLRRLHGLKKGLAVATTEGARTRFEVDENKFQRRITLSAGDNPGRLLYLGTAPAMRKIHARSADDGSVYAVPLSAYEVPATADGWLDSSLVQIPESQLEGIEVSGISLTKSKTEGNEGDGWKADGLTEGEQLDQPKARGLAGDIARLEVQKVLGTEARSEYKQDTPVLVLTLKRSKGDAVTWTLSKPGKGEDYILKSSEHPWYFAVASWSAEPLLEAAKRDALMVSQKPEEAESEEGVETAAPPAADAKTP